MDMRTYTNLPEQTHVLSDPFPRMPFPRKVIQFTKVSELCSVAEW